VVVDLTYNDMGSVAYHAQEEHDTVLPKACLVAQHGTRSTWSSHQHGLDSTLRCAE